jgi:hypothetical protein
MRFAAYFFAASLCACGSSSAPAADLFATVPGHAGLTYFALMKRLVPDLKRDGQGGASGHEVVPFEHLLGKDLKGDPPETIALSSVDVMTIPDDPTRIVLLADLGPSEGFVADAQLLALFALEPAPKLLDVAEVGTDRFTGFRTGPALMLAPRAPLILIVNENNDAGVSYDQIAMIFVRDDRFRLIDSVTAFSQATCSHRRTQVPSFETLVDAGPYSAIRVTVAERVVATHEDCGDDKAPRPHVATYQGTYRWDEKRQNFATPSTQLKRLAAENAKRM